MKLERRLAAKIFRVVYAFLALTGAIVVLVTATPLVASWSRLLSGPLLAPKGDVLVILSSSELQEGMPDVTSYWRAVYGVRSWRGGGFRTVVISGRPAASIRDFLVSGGVPESAIVLETRSDSTRENALYTKPILDSLPGRKVLLTSDYHALRARLAFRKVGLDVVLRPIPDVRKRADSLSARWGAFCDLCLETAKLAGYFCRGWI